MSTIEQATRILDLIRSEATILRALADAIGRDDRPHLALAAAGDRAREIAPWAALGEALALTWPEMTGDAPLPVMETDEQAAELLAVVRDHLAALRHQAEQVVPLDETDHHELAQAARRLAVRAAEMRLAAIVDDVLGEAQDEVPLPVLAVARRAADQRAADATGRLRNAVRREVGRRGPGRRREVMREAGITPNALYAWVPAGDA
ncbi:hypothetical protein [Micromonospora sp. NPDC002575]|uniref:hypothetical protein n=1 Tax=Micromonospora sp. NPDC002575 TaxID=3364222 RepID=UPI0036CE57DA